MWVVLRSGNGWNGQGEFAGPVVGGGSEVDEVLESPSHSFCELDDAVYGLDGCGGHASVEVGQDSIPMLANGLGQRTERVEASWLMTPPSPEAQIPSCLPKQVLLRLTVSGEERAQSCRTQKAVTSPARSKACSGEKRNKWQGPASGGKDAVYVGFDLEQA
jgi:hypothetical protein